MRFKKATYPSCLFFFLTNIQKEAGKYSQPLRYFGSLSIGKDEEIFEN